MRKFKLTILLTVLMSMVGVKSFAYTAQINGIYYNFSETEATVTYLDYQYCDNVYAPHSNPNKDAYSGNIVIPTTVTYNGKNYPVTKIGSYAFYCCVDLYSITIPNTITSIGYSAFEYSSLQIIDINTSNLASIGIDAFRYCPIRTVNLSNITSWLNCSLKNEYASPFNGGATLYVDNEEKTTLSFSIVATSIPAYAFYGCKNITTVNIPAQVSSIGYQAFEGCSSLEAININSNNRYYSSEEGVLYNSDKSVLLFCPKAKVGDLSIPSSVTSVAESACEGCRKLTSIIIRDGMEEIGESAFNGCSALNSTITLPSSLTTIGKFAFRDCTGKIVVNFNVPNASSYDNSPFYGSDFTEVVFGNNVSTIGNYAFYASDMKTIFLSNTLSSIGTSSFTGCKNITL